MPKPELPELAPGDELIVVFPVDRYRPSDPVRARVVKAARVWVDLEEIEPVRSLRRTWRMRLDTQDEGDKNFPRNNSRFYTDEQYAGHLRVLEARELLSREKIEVYGSEWGHGDRVLALADTVRSFQTGGEQE